MKIIFYKRSALILAAALVFADAPAVADDASRACKKNINKQNYKNALVPCQEAAQQGDLDSQVHLATMYYKGKGVKQDYLKAIKWWRSAAMHGLEYRGVNIAAIALLRIDYSSKNLKENHSEVVKQWRNAAMQGDINAQINLGLMYSNGNGIERDYPKADKWWRHAAMQGAALAQAVLAKTLYEGKDIEQDKQEAYIWSALATEQGYGYDFENIKKLRDKIGKELSSGELTQAQDELSRRRAEIENKQKP